MGHFEEMSLKSSSTNLTNIFLFFLFSELAVEFLRRDSLGVCWKLHSGGTIQNTSEAIHSKKSATIHTVVPYPSKNVLTLVFLSQVLIDVHAKISGITSKCRSSIASIAD